jgi:hypothetical protein
VCPCYRDAATRAECSNQLKQIGLATHAYHTQRKRLPPAARFQTIGGTLHRGNLFFWLLPYLEQGNLYDQAKYNAFAAGRIAGGIGAGTANGQPFTAYLCPADDTDSGHIYSEYFARGSYALNAQVFARTGWDIRVRLTDIRDGVSNTILYTEKLQYCENGDLGVGGVIWGLGGEQWNQQLCPVLMSSLTTSGQLLVTGPASKPQAESTPATVDPIRPSSGHHGGLHIVLGDGGVRFISHDIDGDTWWAACTPLGGEVITGDW